MTTKETVKGWFKKYARPTQAQFYSFFDSILWKSEKIPVTQIQDLGNLLIKKADAELVNTLVQQLAFTAKPYNLDATPKFINYLYQNKQVYACLLPIPSDDKGKYTFNHNLGVIKYLRLEVWEDGLPKKDPQMKAREELTQLVYSAPKAIGAAKVSKTKIGAKYYGSLKLNENSIIVEGDYIFPSNKLLYIEFTSKINRTPILAPPRPGVIQR